MSNFLSVATITAALCDSLQKALDVDVPNAKVKPAKPDTDGLVAQPQVNVFLFQVVQNASYRNMDLPFRRSDGTLVSRPKVAVDLHYLFAFHGDDSQLEPQRMLGSVLRTMESNAFLTQAMVEGGLGSSLYHSVLSASDFLITADTVKFTPLSLSVDELSRLWGMFIETTYSLSVAYTASPVVIEAEGAPASALPVKERNVYAFPFRSPDLASVVSAVGENEPIFSGDGLVLRGKRLLSQIVHIRVDDAEIAPSMANVTDTRIELTGAEVGALSAGVHRATVTQPYLIGTPAKPHAGTESNSVPFLVHPKITVDPPASVTGTGSAPRSAQITVHFTPNLRTGQRVTLLMNGATVGVGSFSFRHDPVAAAVSQLVFDVEGIDAGAYLVRAKVDGADSLLTEDDILGSPTFGQWIGPKVVIA